jgi:hypothetical protein
MVICPDCGARSTDGAVHEGKRLLVLDHKRWCPTRNRGRATKTLPGPLVETKTAALSRSLWVC